MELTFEKVVTTGILSHADTRSSSTLIGKACLPGKPQLLEDATLHKIRSRPGRIQADRAVTRSDRRHQLIGFIGLTGNSQSNSSRALGRSTTRQ